MQAPDDMPPPLTLPPLPRDRFDLPPDLLWVMHCSEGPVPRASIEAGRRLLDLEAHPWDMDFGRDVLGLPDRVRTQAARLLGADAGDVSLTQSTSSGLAVIAHGFPFEPGDEILAPLGEFPANAWPWKALESRGVTFREVPLWDGHLAGPGAWDSTPPDGDCTPEQRIADAIGPRTRLLTVSWVRFQDGLRLHLPTLAAACAANDVVLVVDGIQGAGVFTPDLQGVAAFVTGGHKGLLGPAGQGFLWTRPELRSMLLPAGSWLSVADGAKWARPGTDLDRTWLPDGRRLEPGAYNLIGAAILGESLVFLNDAGPDRIAAHVHALQGRLLAGLRRGTTWPGEADRLEPLWATDRLGPFLSLHAGPQAAGVLFDRLRIGADRNIHASVRESYLRVALHGWHDQDDIDRLLEWLG
jgi:selenocysteine lyase/cysteine desulfurase